jgi:hypothetical protein
VAKLLDRQRKNFKILAETVFRADTPPPGLLIGGSSDPQAVVAVQDIWHRSKPWRLDALEGAIERTSLEEAGLRRGYLMTAAGHAMGVSRSEEVHDVRRPITGLRDPRDRDAAKYFFRLMNECYHASGAAAMNVLPGDSVHLLELSGILRASAVSTSRPVRLSSLNITVKMPPLHVLLQLPPDDLLAVRERVGGDFLAEVERWRAHERSSESVQRFAEAYAAEIRLRAKKREIVTLSRLDLFIRRTGSEDLQKAIDGALSGVLPATLVRGFYRKIDMMPCSYGKILFRSDIGSTASSSGDR